MTLEGAKKALRGDRSAAPEGNADMELLDRLHSLRSMLVAVRDSMDDEQSVEAVQGAGSTEAAEEAEQPQRPKYKEQSLFDF